jgi:hypothetical protein
MWLVLLGAAAHSALAFGPAGLDLDSFGAAFDFDVVRAHIQTLPLGLDPHFCIKKMGPDLGGSRPTRTPAG